MRVKFLHRGKTLSLSDNEGIITWMRRNDNEGFRTNEQFMHAYAERKKLFHNFDISTNDVNAFVSDLERYRIIEKISSPLYVSFKRARKKVF